MKTEDTVQINQNEKRAIQYELFTENGLLVPDAASIVIYEYNDGNYTPVFDQNCIIDSNKISIIVDDTTTQNIGNYMMYWKIEKDNQIFYKTTKLVIKDSFC